MSKSKPRPPMRKDGDGHKHTYSYRYGYGYGYGYGGYSRERRPRQLNKALLIGSLLFLIVAAPAIYFWHDYQTKQLSDSLWAYGKELAEQEKWEEASVALYRVWDIRREPELLGDAVDVYDKFAADRDRPGVIAAYQKAIGGLPDRVDLRVRLAELLTRERRYESAFAQSEKILAADAQSLDGQKWKALSLLGLSRTNQAKKGYDVLEELKRSYIDQQHDFDIATALATHIRNDLQAQNGSELAVQADGVMNRLVAANPKNVNARLTRYQYRKQYKIPGAKRDIEEAVLLDPENPVVLRQAAWSALRDAVSSWKTSDYLAARELFKNLIKLEPTDESGYLGLGDTEYLVRGNIGQAIKIWNEGRKEAGDSLPLLLRIAEGQTNSFKFDDVEQTLGAVDKYMSTLSVQGLERNRNWATASASLFRGKMLLARNKPVEAIVELKVASDLGVKTMKDGDSLRPEDKSTAFTALISLGQTYAKMGLAKDAASSFERALTVNPESEIAMVQGAEAWAELGDLDRAIRNTEKAKRLRKPSPDVLRSHAQYLLEKELAAPSRSRDWTKFEEALGTVRAQLADSWQLRLLEADYAIHRDRVNTKDYSAAVGKLLSIEQDFPKEIEIWKRLPFVYESIDMPSDADRALNKLEQLTTSSPTTKLLVIDLLLGRNQPDRAKQVLDSLSSSSLAPLEKLAREQTELRITEFLGDDQAIDAALVKLRSKDETNSMPIERLLDRRLCNASQTKVPSNAELIEDLKKRQPDSESTWEYYEARLELMKEEPDRRRLQTYATSLLNRLPYWSRTQELSGRIAAFEGNARDARIAFSGAISKPNPNPELVRHVIEENVQSGDFLANTKILEKHKQVSSLARIITNNRWSKLQKELDFTFVNRGLANSAKEGSVTWSELIEGENNTDADSNLEQLMLSLWKETDATAKTELLKKIESQEMESGDFQAFVLGQANQLAGVFNVAKEKYQAVVDSSERRLQAEIYSGIATNQILRERSRQIELAQSSTGSTKRLEAIMKLRRAGQNDLEAARILLQGLVDSRSEETDRLLLAKCLEQLGRQNDALEQLEAVVESDATAHHIATLTDFLLRAGENEKAQVWIEQLEGQTGWEKKTVSLRVRWMAATNRQKEIGTFVERFATERFRRSPTSVAQEMRDIAEVYQSVNMTAEAKRWLSTLASRFPDQAEPLSRLLVENDETDRAVQRCIDQLNNEPTVETATLLARILVYGKVNPETLNQVTPLLEDCRTRFPDNPSLLFALGNLEIKLNDKSDAIETLMQVTELQPGHYLAWNNLAALLAEEDGRETEAMATIDKAIEQAAYEIPTLLDTKAVVLMHQDRFQAAATLLKEKVTQTRAGMDPRFFFHLAISLDRLDETEAALDAMKEAKELDLKKSFLTEFEKTEFDRLDTKFADASK